MSVGNSAIYITYMYVLYEISNRPIHMSLFLTEIEKKAELLVFIPLYCTCRHASIFLNEEKIRHFNATFGKILL